MKSAKKLHDLMKEENRSTSHEAVCAIKRAKRRFLMVGALLFVFTGTTVAVATMPSLDFGGHGLDRVDVVIGLFISTFKVLLVALVFMHLNHEKPMIYLIFGVGLLHAGGFFMGTYLHFAYLTYDKYFYSSGYEEGSFERIINTEEATSNAR